MKSYWKFSIQFFMDYNLYGMNLIHASGVKFRAPVRLLAGMYVKHKTRLFQLALSFDKPQWLEINWLGRKIDVYFILFF